MTMEIERDALLGALRQVVDVVEARTTIPILSNLLVSVDGGALRVSGTDLNIQVTSLTEAAGTLATTVEAQKLLAAVSSLKPGRLVLAPVDGRHAITIKQGRSVRTLPTLPTENFPERKPIDPIAAFVLPAAALARLLEPTSIAQCTDETRYYLKGVFLHVTDDKLRAVATDGHRLIRVVVPAPADAAGMPDMILPSKLVTLLRKLMQKPVGNVSITATRQAIHIAIGTVEISAALVDATYPDYSRIIPEPSDFRFVVHRDALIEPVKAAISVLSDKVRAIAIDCSAAEPEVTASDQNGNAACEPLDAAIEGTGLRFGVNAAYLVQVAGVFAESGKLTVSLHDPASAMLIVGDKDPDITAVIMPMRA